MPSPSSPARPILKRMPGMAALRGKNEAIASNVSMSPRARVQFAVTSRTTPSPLRTLRKMPHIPFNEAEDHPRVRPRLSISTMASEDRALSIDINHRGQLTHDCESGDWLTSIKSPTSISADPECVDLQEVGYMLACHIAGSPVDRRMHTSGKNQAEGNPNGVVGQEDTSVPQEVQVCGPATSIRIVPKSSKESLDGLIVVPTTEDEEDVLGQMDNSFLSIRLSSPGLRPKAIDTNSEIGETQLSGENTPALSRSHSNASRSSSGGPVSPSGEVNQVPRIWCRERSPARHVPRIRREDNHRRGEESRSYRF